NELGVAKGCACVQRNFDCDRLWRDLYLRLLPVEMSRGNFRHPCFRKKDANRLPKRACANQGVAPWIASLRLQVVLDPVPRSRDPRGGAIHVLLLWWGAQPARHIRQVVGRKAVRQHYSHCTATLMMQLNSEDTRTLLPGKAVIVSNSRPHVRGAPVLHQNPALCRLEQYVYRVVGCLAAYSR